MKGIFDAYVLWPFGKKNISELVTRMSTRDSIQNEIMMEYYEEQLRLDSGLSKAVWAVVAVWLTITVAVQVTTIVQW